MLQRLMLWMFRKLLSYEKDLSLTFWIHSNQFIFYAYPHSLNQRFYSQYQMLESYVPSNRRFNPGRWRKFCIMRLIPMLFQEKGVYYIDENNAFKIEDPKVLLENNPSSVDILWGSMPHRVLLDHDILRHLLQDLEISPKRFLNALHAFQRPTSFEFEGKALSSHERLEMAQYPLLEDHYKTLQQVLKPYYFRSLFFIRLPIGSLVYSKDGHGFPQLLALLADSR